MPKGIFLRKSGPSKILELEEFQSKPVLDDEFKIQIKYAGVNFADILARRGIYKWVPPKPYIPGFEAVGEIIEIGSTLGRDSFDIGEKVIVGTQYGCYATEINVRKENVFKILPHYSLKENAGFFATWITSFLGLNVLGRQVITEGSRVLINSAAGGVGSSAVQIAKKMGAYVIGTVGHDDKINFLNDLGVDEVINYNKTNLLSVVEPASIDFCLESVGGSLFKESMKSLKPLGMLVIIGLSSIDFSIFRPFTWFKAWRTLPKVNVVKMIGKNQTLSGLHIGRLLDSGYTLPWTDLVNFVTINNLKPVIGKVFNLKDVKLAHDLIESKKSIGKIILKCDE